MLKCNKCGRVRHRDKGAASALLTIAQKMVEDGTRLQKYKRPEEVEVNAIVPVAPAEQQA